MALQGTLDTFELPDVLRLLASTRKTGRLRLEGDRGVGDLWMEDGRVVAVESGARVETVDEHLFELLRAHEGSFAFEPGVECPHAGVLSDVEPLLESVEQQLAEWREIEAVVPSLSAWIGLTPELPGPSVTVDEETWRVVAAIGGGLTVAELGDLLGLGEVAVSRIVRDVVELGLGEVRPAPVHARRAPEPLPEPEAEPVVEDEHEPVVEDEYEAAEPAYEPEYEAPAPPVPLFEPVAEPDTLPAVAAFDAEDPADAEDVARQLAMLSPRAAQAVAAATAAGDEAAAAAALDELEDGDEPVNRGLLLKFLGSVKS